MKLQIGVLHVGIPRSSARPVFAQPSKIIQISAVAPLKEFGSGIRVITTNFRIFMGEVCVPLSMHDIDTG